MQAVEGKERALRERGAAWNPPTLTTSLRSLPFLAEVSDALFEEIVLQVLPPSSCCTYSLGHACRTLAVLWARKAWSDLNHLSAPPVKGPGVILKALPRIMRCYRPP